LQITHLEPVPSFNKSYSGENYNDEAYQKHNSHKTCSYITDIITYTILGSFVIPI